MPAKMPRDGSVQLVFGNDRRLTQRSYIAAVALSTETAMNFWLADQSIETGDAERTATPLIIAAVNATLRMSHSSFEDCQYHWAQTPPFHRAQRRAWRMPLLDTQAPLTTTMPGPQPMRTLVIMSSGL